MLSFLSAASGPVVEGLREFETEVARSQKQYTPVRVLRGNTTEGPVMTRWALTPEQRQAITDGADVFVELLTFGSKQQPLRVSVSSGPGAIWVQQMYQLYGPPAGVGEAVNPCNEKAEYRDKA